MDKKYFLSEINNPHDKICRKTLNKKKEATKIINRILDKNNKIKENSIEKYISSFISNELKNSESDVIYKLKNENVFFLIEHQTKIDYLMPYRILQYELEIISSVLIDRKYIDKNYKFPEIIAIVLYTGNKKWDGNLDLRSSQYKWRKYEGQELSKYNIIDINQIEDKELLEENSIISKVMLIEKSKTENDLWNNLNKIYIKIQQAKDIYSKEDREFLNKIISTLTVNKVGKEKAKSILKKLDFGGDVQMLAAIELIQKTNRQLIQTGRREGKREGKIEVIKNMLKENFPISLIAKVTELTEEEIKKYKN